MIVPAIARPLGCLNKPIIEKMAPSNHTTKSTNGIHEVTNKAINDRTKPAVPIPLVLAWLM